ncbi:MAG: hypothetical protein DWQ36_11475 [Acidobacteria bacterium]|nr:MAG: hypothetical protein DWQ30_17270 [Acidobacteriota bacterium]REK07824.1 MAG: hypothetical protein DWQ36_11475 [Acidobacteriota bacterium]
MRPPQPRRRSLAAILRPLALCLPLLVVACDSSTTDPDEILVFDGIVRFEGESFHSFTTTDEGPLEVTLTRLDALLVDITVLRPENLAISVGIGQEVEGECLENVQFTLQERGLLFFNLVPRTYCLSVFDGGQLPEDASVSYTVTLELP